MYMSKGNPNSDADEYIVYSSSGDSSEDFADDTALTKMQV